MTARKTISVEEFDRIFDEGKEDIMCYLDLDSAVRINASEGKNSELKRVNVDFPVWMVEGLDAQANKLAINRQAVIKTWIAERLEQVQ